MLLSPSLTHVFIFHDVGLIIITTLDSPMNIICHQEATLSSLNLPLSNSPNCSRNSRLLKDKVDLKWLANENIVIVKTFHENVRSKTCKCMRLGSFFKRCKMMLLRIARD